MTTIRVLFLFLGCGVIAVTGTLVAQDELNDNIPELADEVAAEIATEDSSEINPALEIEVPALTSSSGSNATPTLKFFFFDQRQTEWTVSAEADRLQNHLEQNEDSAKLYESLQSASQTRTDLLGVRATMSKWIEDERKRFSDTSARSARRIRVAEGVTAYMRAYDFEIGQLIPALLRRSGAREVELAAIHLVDRNGNSSYKLKVMLPYDQIQIDKQGFDVVLNSSNVTDASVVYALALALYEVHEILEAQSNGEPTPEIDIEQLPVPEPTPAIQPSPRLQSAGPERSILG